MGVTAGGWTAIPDLARLLPPPRPAAGTTAVASRHATVPGDPAGGIEIRREGLGRRRGGGRGNPRGHREDEQSDADDSARRELSGRRDGRVRRGGRQIAGWSYS